MKIEKIDEETRRVTIDNGEIVMVERKYSRLGGEGWAAAGHFVTHRTIKSAIANRK